MTGSDNPNSALWNAVETILASWAELLTESLETDTEPPWGFLSRDLDVCRGLIARILV